MFPRLVTIGDAFTLHTYGLLVALGLLVGLFVARRYARRSGLSPDIVWNLGIYMALAALVGAKVVMILADWNYYSQNPGQILSWSALQAGGFFYGGVLFAVAVGAWYTHRYRLGFAPLADAYAPGIALGHAIGRLGCFSAGCCWGKPTEAAWGVTFTNPYSSKLVGVPLGIPLHPTQLYEAFAEAAIFATLVVLWRRRRFPGQVFAAYLMLYAAARFVIEFFRGDPRGGTLFGGALSMPQAVSLGLLVAALLFWSIQRRRGRAASTAYAD